MDIKDVLKLPSKTQKQKKAEEYSALCEASELTVLVTLPKRTFWEKAEPGTFRLYPNNIYISELEVHYVQMRKMIFGNDVPELLMERYRCIHL